MIGARILAIFAGLSLVSIGAMPPMVRGESFIDVGMAINQVNGTVNETTQKDSGLLMKIAIIVLIIILLILLWLLLKPKKREQPEEGTRKNLGYYTGWMVVWIDAEGLYPDVAGEANMKLVYGHAAIFEKPDGSVIVESISETFRETYYQPWGMMRKMNPHLAGEMVQEYAMRQGYEVAWADGTDKYLVMWGIPKPSLKKLLLEQPWKRTPELQKLAAMVKANPLPEGEG
jgi:hypothetical protein